MKGRVYSAALIRINLFPVRYLSARNILVRRLLFSCAGKIFLSASKKSPDVFNDSPLCFNVYSILYFSSARINPSPAPVAVVLFLRRLFLFFAFEAVYDSSYRVFDVVAYIAVYAIRKASVSWIFSAYDHKINSFCMNAAENPFTRFARSRLFNS